MSEPVNETKSPLDGVRVLDLSRILAAPFASQLLGDLGAEVIKVERPGSGDDARQYGPPFLGDPSQQASGFYLSTNRNKKSVTVDYSSAAGAEIIRQLASESDIVIENFRSGVLEKYGLDYETLRVINPRLIYCSITGFGQDGPYSARAGYDGIFQAMCGMMSVSGIPDGEPGAGPMKVGVSMVDVLTGLYTGNAILAALRHRDVTGGDGQYIDMSLLDCGLASLSHFVQNYLVSGVPAPRRGNGGFGGIPSQAFTCADDKDIFVVASTPKQFAALAGAMDREDLIDQPEYATVSARIQNRDLVLAELSSVFRRSSAAEWIKRLEEADVPCSPVNSLPEVFENPQVIHRGMLRRDDDDQVDLLRNPIRFSDTPITTYRRPPAIGENTREVLTAVLDMTTAEIAELERSGVI